MKILSVNVGLPRDVEWKGKTVSTGIFKEPVEGRIRIGKLNLAGDGQADLSVHGGIEKAVYAYASEHYPHWREQYPELDLGWASFGENLTTEGLLEDAAGIGDRFRCGSAELRVTQPRQPCYKLGIRFGRPDVVKRFQASGRSGIYFAVVRAGEVSAGDEIERIERDPRALSVAQVAELVTAKQPDPDLLERAAVHELLSAGLREHFEQLLARSRRGERT
jgi:MOSC domain-containing protein YiiM